MMPTDKCQMNRDERARVIKSKIASRTETIKESVLQWLIESDPYYICPQNDNVAQRYAAAIVHQDALQNNTVYLKDECDWPGFICDSKNNIVAVDDGEWLISFYLFCIALEMLFHSYYCIPLFITKTCSE